MSPVNEVIQAWKSLVKAVAGKDLEGLSKHLDEDVIYHHGDSSPIHGKQPYLDICRDAWHVIPDLNLKSEESLVTVSESGDLGVLAGEHVGTVVESGEVFGKWKHLFVWQKKKGEWKVITASIYSS